MQSNFLWTFFLFGQSQNEIQDRNYGFSILTIDGSLTLNVKINLNPIRLQNDIRGTRHDDQSCYAWWCYCCTLNQIHRQIGLDLKRRREEAKASLKSLPDFDWPRRHLQHHFESHFQDAGEDLPKAVTTFLGGCLSYMLCIRYCDGKLPGTITFDYIWLCCLAFVKNRS